MTKAKPKAYKIIMAPEGQPTYTDSEGNERPMQRTVEVVAESEKEAKRIVDAQSWDIHVEHDEPLYEIMSISQVKDSEA